MQTTNIGWCDYTSNPIALVDKAEREVWGCVKVSRGCHNCYAEALAKRWGRGGPFTKGTMKGLRATVKTRELAALNKSPQIAGKSVFLMDMSDLFGEWVHLLHIMRVYETCAQRPDVLFYWLTKRTERMRDLMMTFPVLPNVMLGASAETGVLLWERGAHLNTLAHRGWRTFLSIEPMLESMDLEVGNGYLGAAELVIVGAESGSGRRPVEVEWIVNLALAARQNGHLVYVKQDGHRFPGQQGRIPDAIWAMKDRPPLHRG